MMPAPLRFPFVLLSFLILVPSVGEAQSRPSSDASPRTMAVEARSPAAEALVPSADVPVPAPAPPPGYALVRPDRGTPVLGIRQEARDRNLPLIAAGATLLVAGSFIDDSAGTVVMVTGATLAAVGVYRWTR